MSAPKHAIPLEEDNPSWKSLGRFTCQSCGYQGKGQELLCVDESETLWCPVCRNAGWVWD